MPQPTPPRLTLFAKLLLTALAFIVIITAFLGVIALGKYFWGIIFN